MILLWAGVFNLYPTPGLGDNASPAPNPPRIEVPPPNFVVHSALSQAQAPLASQEWTYHKTPDHRHPDGNEQQFMWLMNRGRANPVQEGAWLSNTGDARISGAIQAWNVDLGVMRAEFNGYDAKPPAAFDVRLHYAARAHSLDLIARDAQDHTGQFTHVGNSGFQYYQLRGNVFSYTEYALYGHAAFNIDWGDDDGDGTGMQKSRGHRKAIMSIDGDYTNVGLSVVPESNPTTQVGPLVTTANFCYANTNRANHYNRFLVGTVWQDANGNDQYDPGEGMAGITVMPDTGDFFAVTADSGGYAFPAVSPGICRVTFSGSGITTPVTRIAVVDSSSVLRDLKYSGSHTHTPLAETRHASDITTDSVNLNGTAYANGFNTTYYFQYGLTTAYGSTTPMDDVSIDSLVTTVVSGLTENSIYHFRLVAVSAHGTSYGEDRTFRSVSPPITSTAAPPPASGGGGGGGGGCFIGSLTSESPEYGRQPI